MDATSFASSRRRALVIAALLAAATACLPLFIKDVYVLNILVLTLMYAALSQSW
ncbi:MAG: branched-chain amino acid ABC transporter permease, partial [Hyphomicrobiales bacterium]|nr:branched-chain amino acid ABC transporter permease [Hyphomicrobiales bacterium]